MHVCTVDAKSLTWIERAFLLRMTKKAITAANTTTPPTTPAIIGIKGMELPGVGAGVADGGGVELSTVLVSWGINEADPVTDGEELVVVP